MPRTGRRVSGGLLAALAAALLLAQAALYWAYSSIVASRSANGLLSGAAGGEWYEQRHPASDTAALNGNGAKEPLVAAAAAPRLPRKLAATFSAPPLVLAQSAAAGDTAAATARSDGSSAERAAASAAAPAASKAPAQRNATGGLSTAIFTTPRAPPAPTTPISLPAHPQQPSPQRQGNASTAGGAATAVTEEDKAAAASKTGTAAKDPKGRGKGSAKEAAPSPPPACPDIRQPEFDGGRNVPAPQDLAFVMDCYWAAVVNQTFVPEDAKSDASLQSHSGLAQVSSTDAHLNAKLQSTVLNSKLNLNSSSGTTAARGGRDDGSKRSGGSGGLGASVLEAAPEVPLAASGRWWQAEPTAASLGLQVRLFDAFLMLTCRLQEFCVCLRCGGDSRAVDNVASLHPFRSLPKQMISEAFVNLSAPHSPLQAPDPADDLSSIPARIAFINHLALKPLKSEYKILSIAMSLQAPDPDDDLSTIPARIAFINQLAAGAQAALAAAKAARAVAGAEAAGTAATPAAGAVVTEAAGAAGAAAGAAVGPLAAVGDSAAKAALSGNLAGGGTTTAVHGASGSVLAVSSTRSIASDAPPPAPSPLPAPPAAALAAPKTAGLAAVAIFTTWMGDVKALRRELLPWLSVHAALGVVRFYILYDGTDAEVVLRLGAISHVAAFSLREPFASAQLLNEFKLWTERNRKTEYGAQVRAAFISSSVSHQMHASTASLAAVKHREVKRMPF